MLMKDELFEMECVSSSEISLLCCLGDLVQIVCFPGHSIIHFQIFISHMPACSLVRFMHEKKALTREQYILIPVFMGSRWQQQTVYKRKVLNREYSGSEGRCQFTSNFVNRNSYNCEI